MNYVYKVFSAWKDFYNDINQATLTGAIDVVVVEQKDGSFICSPFHVRFGKMGVLRSKEKRVDISINGEPVDLQMKLEDTGVAHFVEEVDDEVPAGLSTSPLPGSEAEELMAQGIARMKESDQILDQKCRLEVPSDASVVIRVDGQDSRSSSSSSIELKSGVKKRRLHFPDDSCGRPFSDTEEGVNSGQELERSGVFSDSEAVISSRKIIHKQKSSEIEKSSLLSSVLNRLVRRPSKNNDVEGGLSLSAVDKLSPKQAAQYIRPKTEEETDSGTSSVYESSLRSQTPGCDVEEETRAIDLQLSLCGGLKGPDSQIPDDKFERHLVSFDALCQKPSLLADPNLVLKLNGKFYIWDVAAPLILSLLAFNKPLPEKRMNSLIRDHMPQKRNWFRIPWGRRQTSQPSEEIVVQKDVDAEDGGQFHLALSSDDDFTGTDEETSQKGSPRKGETASIPIEYPQDQNKNGKHYRRSYQLSSEGLKKLNLKQGANEVVFSVTTKYQGTAKSLSTIYLWKYTDKVVISDIDGTITKSDVYGQILPFFGATWAQTGVAKLFTAIYENGYQFVYLSSRAIGQSRITRGYLKKLKQGEISLPDGPLLLSPTSLFTAFHQEVIKREPEKFKMAALDDIRRLFPKSANPYHAGFGNRKTDCMAYESVGIPRSRIYIINHKGEVAHAQSCTFQTSYSKLLDDVDHIFQPCESKKSLVAIDEQYNNFHFWRSTPPKAL
eukprot:m.74148 g.74148  ORF g.74148 m.74148 type:complete len:722 (+) comp35877_c0_seq5:55-2220(+)